MSNLPKQFKSLRSLPGVRIDLRYATDNNFLGRKVYGDGDLDFLHEEAFEKLVKATSVLKRHHSDIGFLILDALRPRKFQRVLFDVVKGTDQEIYVADPDKGSVHNYGFAVDLTLVGANGQELDMGTPFDDFTLKAQPRHEEEFLRSGDLSLTQIENRKILRGAMLEAGFFGIPHEWWHFNARPLSELKNHYLIVE